MRKLFIFMMLSLDGYFEGPDHDLSWHMVDAEFNQFAIAQMQEAGTLLFGRRTFQLMENYWPAEANNPEADADDKTVADLMNSLPKVVVTQKGIQTDWEPTQIITDNVVEQITALKNQEGKDIALLASSNLCLTLLENNLLDELRIMVNPIAIGAGTTLFEGLQSKRNFKLLNTRTFGNGNILNVYQPVN